MLVVSIVGFVLVLTAIAVRRITSRHRARARRRARRSRNLGYMQFWGEFMVRPRVKRLTFVDDRRGPEEPAAGGRR